MILVVHKTEPALCFLILLFILFSGCATSKYFNKNYPTDKQDYYYKIDSAECKAIAAGASPVPQVHVNQQGSAYSTGNLNIYGSDGYSAYGSYNQNTYSNNPAAQWADIANMAAALGAQTRQNNLYNACMTRRGWVEVEQKANLDSENASNTDQSFKETEDESEESLRRRIFKAADKEDFTTAANLSLRLAEDGDHVGQYLLGVMYYSGNGVPQSYAEAKKWFRMSAEQGNQFAQYGLADIYYAGIDVTQDYKKAFKWADLAAKQGNSKAQFLLAVMYYTGKGADTQNFKKAAKWFRFAAKQGDPEAQFGLGSLYTEGQGVPQNYIKAHAWYNLAAANGHENALISRDAVVEKMTSTQIAEAQKLASDWMEQINKNKQNE